MPAAALATDSTSTTISCAPSSVTTGSATTCTATVTYTGTNSPAPTPTGSVNFTASPNTVSPSSPVNCPLTAASGSGDQNQCSVNLTPSAGGDYQISAAYASDGGLQASNSSAFTVTSVDPTSTSLTCSPSTVPINSETECTAVLSDPFGGPTPTGTLTFSSSPNTGTFGPVGCDPSGAGSATCHVTFTPSVAGTYTVNAAYGGDTHHAASAGSSSVTGTTAPAGGGPGSHTGGSATLTIQVTSGPPPPATLTIARRAQVSLQHVAALLLSCAGSPDTSCNGTLFLTTTVKVKVKFVTGHGKRRHRKTRIEPKAVLVGSVNYSLAEGTTHRFKLRISKAGVKAFGHKSRLKTTAQAAGAVIGTVALIGPKHKKHHKKKHHHK
jgi:hypothetical protein